MSSLPLIILLAIVPIPVIYLFYFRYFLVKPSYLHHLEYFIYGAILALIMVLIGPYVLPMMNFQSTILRGFLGAALIEKIGALIFIAFIFYRLSPDLMVVNMVISAMLLGLGFATLENILYAMAVHEPVILVRLFTSVPLHVLTCGLIGYGLALIRFSGSRGNKIRYALGALLVPFLFHGLYDTLLVNGGVRTYWTAPLLVVLIIGMEYILAKSQSYPLLDGLRKHRISLEDWVTIQREPQYERWILRSMGSRNREHVPFFRLNLGRLRVSIIIVFLTGSVISLFGRHAIIALLNYRLDTHETLMLFTLLPVLYSLNLFAIGVVNPKYFQNSLIRIPIIIDADMPVNGSSVRSITYHVTGDNCYLKTVDPMEEGTELSLVFTCADFSSPPVTGAVVFDSHDEQKQLSGTLVRFTDRPRGYRLFLVKYNLYRIASGLFFNMRLPGFRGIRQLFVRPASVMQEEWRFSAGHRLFEQGDEGRVFYLVRKGEVDIIKTLENGMEVRMTTLGEGDIFGEMAIVGHQPRLATAVCRTECLLAVAEADNLDALIENNPVFAQKLIRIFANRLHASERIMLRSMADIGTASKKREELLMSLSKMLFIMAGLDGGKNALPARADIDTLAAQLNMSKKALSDLMDGVSGINNIDEFENFIGYMLKGRK